MKASQYNLVFKYEDMDIGFNCVTQDFIIFDELMLELYLNGEKRDEFEELQEVYPEFYDFLVEKGFLIENEIDQFQELKDLSHRIDNKDTNFHLIINPTMNCNFKCWYCYETHIKDSKMDSLTQDKIISFVKKTVKENPQIQHFSISFFGGEPMLYFDKVIRPILAEAVPFLKSENITFQAGMTTNGLLFDQNKIDFSKEHSLDGFQITLDGDKDQHDKIRFISEGRGSFDKIVDNIFLIARNNLKTYVRVNCSADTLAGIPLILEKFNELDPELKKNVDFDFHKVWQVQEDIEDPLMRYRVLFRENGFKVRGGIYDTLVNSCYADKRNHVTINYNGEIFKCTARDFKSDSVEGQLNNDGTIVWNEKYEKRLNSKFRNKPCESCKIFPICGGGCSQQALEHENVEYCVHNFDEDSKVKVVIGKFLETMFNNELEVAEVN